MLREYYTKFNIVEAAIIDSESVIELTVTDENSIADIKDFLRNNNITDEFIDRHFKFVIGEQICMDYEDEELSDDQTSVASGTYTANPGRKVRGWRRYESRYSVATVGFCAERASKKGIVTAWHFVVGTKSYYWELKAQGYFATSSGVVNSSTYDASFIPFNTGDGVTTNVSRTIYGTTTQITHVGTANTFNTINGHTVHLYGQTNPNITGTVNLTSADYNMSYNNAEGASATTLVKDNLRLTGAGITPGDSGGPVTYENGGNVTLLGIISGKSSNYQYISKITNINSALGTSVV